MRAAAVGLIVAAGTSLADNPLADPMLREPPPIRDDGSRYLGMRPPALEAHAPVTEPRFALADAYGVRSWTDACETRGDLKIKGDADEVARYLRAWCDGVRGRDTTLAELGALSATGTPGLADAVHRDVLGLLADTYDAPHALDWIQQKHFAGGDELADIYVAANRPHDAAGILEADLPFGPNADDHVRCMHYGRIAFNDIGGDVPSPAAMDARTEVGRLAKRGSDEDCQDIAAYLKCPLITGDRAGYVTTLASDIAACRPVLPHVDVAAIYVRAAWPINLTTDYSLWWERWAKYATDIAQLDATSLASPQVQDIGLEAYDVIATICETTPTRAEVIDAMAKPDPRGPSPFIAAMKAIPSIVHSCRARFEKKKPIDVYRR